MKMAEQLVLVVDDDDANRFVLQEILADAGYRIAAVASPSEAREMVRDERPALVILDGSAPTEKQHASDLAAEVQEIGAEEGGAVVVEGRGAARGVGHEKEGVAGAP